MTANLGGWIANVVCTALCSATTVVTVLLAIAYGVTRADRKPEGARRP